MSYTRQLAVFCLTAVVLASTPLATKVSIGPEGFNRKVAAPLRMTIACVACLIVASIPAIRRLEKKSFIVRKELPWLMGVGATNALAFYLTYYALGFIPSVMLTLTSATQPFMVSFLMHRTKMEHVTASSVTGCAIAFVGVAILTLREGTGDRIGAWPMLALLFIAVIISSSQCLLKKAHASSKLGSQLVIYASSGLILWLVCLVCLILEPQSLIMPHPTTSATLALLYCSLVGSLLGFVLYMNVFRTAGAVTASSFALVQPPVALLISQLLCLEQTVITPGMVAAFPFILIGVGFNWRAVYLEQRRVAAEKERRETAIT